MNSILTQLGRGAMVPAQVFNANILAELHSQQNIMVTNAPHERVQNYSSSMTHTTSNISYGDVAEAQVIITAFVGLVSAWNDVVTNVLPVKFTDPVDKIYVRTYKIPTVRMHPSSIGTRPPAITLNEKSMQFDTLIVGREVAFHKTVQLTSLGINLQRMLVAAFSSALANTISAYIVAVLIQTYHRFVNDMLSVRNDNNSLTHNSIYEIIMQAVDEFGFIQKFPAHAALEHSVTITKQRVDKWQGNIDTIICTQELITYLATNHRYDESGLANSVYTGTNPNQSFFLSLSKTNVHPVNHPADVHPHEVDNSLETETTVMQYVLHGFDDQPKKLFNYTTNTFEKLNVSEELFFADGPFGEDGSMQQSIPVTSAFHDDNGKLPNFIGDSALLSISSLRKLATKVADKVKGNPAYAGVANSFIEMLGLAQMHRIYWNNGKAQDFINAITAPGPADGAGGNLPSISAQFDTFLKGQFKNNYLIRSANIKLETKNVPLWAFLLFLSRWKFDNDQNAAGVAATDVDKIVAFHVLKSILADSVAFNTRLAANGKNIEYKTKDETDLDGQETTFNNNGNVAVGRFVLPAIKQNGKYVSYGFRVANKLYRNAADAVVIEKLNEMNISDYAGTKNDAGENIIELILKPFSELIAKVKPKLMQPDAYEAAEQMHQNKGKFLFLSTLYKQSVLKNQTAATFLTEGNIEAELRNLATTREMDGYGGGKMVPIGAFGNDDVARYGNQMDGKIAFGSLIGNKIMRFLLEMKPVRGLDDLMLLILMFTTLDKQSLFDEPNYAPVKLLLIRTLRIKAHGMIFVKKGPETGETHVFTLEFASDESYTGDMKTRYICGIQPFVKMPQNIHYSPFALLQGVTESGSMFVIPCDNDTTWEDMENNIVAVLVPYTDEEPNFFPMGEIIPPRSLMPYSNAVNMFIEFNTGMLGKATKGLYEQLGMQMRYNNRLASIKHFPTMMNMIWRSPYLVERGNNQWENVAGFGYLHSYPDKYAQYVTGKGPLLG